MRVVPITPAKTVTPSFAANEDTYFTLVVDRDLVIADPVGVSGNALMWLELQPTGPWDPQWGPAYRFQGGGYSMGANQPGQSDILVFSVSGGVAKEISRSTV